MWLPPGTKGVGMLVRSPDLAMVVVSSEIVTAWVIAVRTTG